MLWHDAFAGDFTDEDAAHASGGVHVLVLEAELVVAHAAVVPRELLVGDRPVAAGYVEGVATAPARQGAGLGSSVMTGVGRVIRSSYDLGALSTSAHGFYVRLGWERWQGPTFVVRHGERVRTEDEDDGVMVLRTPRSRHLALDQPLACHDRPGDAW